MGADLLGEVAVGETATPDNLLSANMSLQTACQEVITPI
jgi:hypothetical protein